MPRVLAKIRCRAILSICRTFALSLCSNVSWGLDEVEANKSVVTGENDNEPCHAPWCRLPERRLNLLICRSFRERMMGLEPTTFCMASASGRSRPFAPVRSNWPFAAVSVGASERERTRANAQPCHSCHASLAHRDTSVADLSRGCDVDPLAPLGARDRVANPTRAARPNLLGNSTTTRVGSLQLVERCIDDTNRPRSSRRRLSGKFVARPVALERFWSGRAYGRSHDNCDRREDGR
jgi:hypothetical protein